MPRSASGYARAPSTPPRHRCQHVATEEVSRFYAGAGGLVAAIGSAVQAAGLDRAGLRPVDLDAALTVHVGMNVSDKHALYAEAFRVLRPGGRFVVYDVLQGEGGDVRYPVPWANDPSTSFLATVREMRELLPAAGFEIVAEADSTEASFEWFHQLRTRIEQDGPPPVTFAVFLGDDFGQMAANQLTNLAEHRIRTVMYTCTRPVGSSSPT